jgi:hypothetical protein
VGLLMLRLLGFSVGALAFGVAHVVERAQWHGWFHGEYEPWFLNSGRAILFTLGCVWLVGAAVAALNPSTRPVRGITIGAGAFAAMTTVMFLSESGPGTIFPIVLVAGGVLLLLGSATGAWMGTQIGRTARGRR